MERCWRSQWKALVLVPMLVPFALDAALVFGKVRTVENDQKSKFQNFDFEIDQPPVPATHCVD